MRNASPASRRDRTSASTVDGTPTAPGGPGLWIVLAVAAGLRLSAACLLPNLVHPDEIFQVLEPAHRLVFGNGLIAWEFVAGIRSWIFPGVMAGPLWIGRRFGADPGAGLTAVRLFLIAVSLVPVAVAYRWGERLRGLRGGLTVGGFAAVWVDLIYFAPHPLSDVIAGDVLMGALYAALPLTTRPSRRRLVVAGALFGLTFVLRFQLAPALLVGALFACGRRPRAWLALACGAAPVVMASGALDWLTLGTPFQSIWLNLWLNLFAHVSQEFGTAGGLFFLDRALAYWGVAILAVLPGCLVGGRRFPALLAVVLTIAVTQTLIDHKEWRFLVPALAPAVTLCGIAAVEQVERLAKARGADALRLTCWAIGLWSALSLLAAVGPPYRHAWVWKRDLLGAFAAAARRPGLCGLGLIDTPWVESPGSVALPPGLPIHVDTADGLPGAAAYNAAIRRGPGPPLQPPFRRLACFAAGSGRPDGRATSCVWVRPGACRQDAAPQPGPNWPKVLTDARGEPRWDLIRPGVATLLSRGTGRTVPPRWPDTGPVR